MFVETSMIDSDDPIHRIKNHKKLAEKIKKQMNEYMDPHRFLGWSKKKKKFILKKFKRNNAFNNNNRYKKHGRRRTKSQ